MFICPIGIVTAMYGIQRIFNKKDLSLNLDKQSVVGSLLNENFILFYRINQL